MSDDIEGPQDESEDTTPVARKYAPGTANHTANQLRDTRKRERQKREANRPTGTEIAQIKQKQQEMLETQQRTIKGLEEAQEQIKRVTPSVSSVEQSVGGVAFGSSWSTLMTLPANRDTSDGKTKALVLVAVSAVKSGDGMPLLEVLVGGTRVGSAPGVTANGDSFGASCSDIINSDQTVTLRGKSTVDTASPISGATMTVTVMSIA